MTIKKGVDNYVVNNGSVNGNGGNNNNNGNVSGGGALEKAGLNIPQRRGLFFGVCIWVRLALAVGVYFAAQRYPNITAGIVLAATGCALLGLGWQHYKNRNVWWSRPSHMVLAAMIMLASVLVLLKQVPATTLSIFVALDVVFGLAYALLATKP